MIIFFHGETGDLHSELCCFSSWSNKCIHDSSTIKMQSRNVSLSFCQCHKWVLDSNTYSLSFNACGIHNAQVLYLQRCLVWVRFLLHWNATTWSAVYPSTEHTSHQQQFTTVGSICCTLWHSCDRTCVPKPSFNSLWPLHGIFPNSSWNLITSLTSLCFESHWHSFSDHNSEPISTNYRTTYNGC